MFEPPADRSQVFERHRHAIEAEPVNEPHPLFGPICELVRAVTGAMGHAEPATRTALLAAERDPEAVLVSFRAAAQRLGIALPAGIEPAGGDQNQPEGQQ